MGVLVKRLGVLLAALASAVLATPAVAAAASPAGALALPAALAAGTGADPQAARQAQYYLDSVRVPDGSKQVSRIAGPLNETPDRMGSVDCPVTGRSRYWMVPVGLDEFDEFIAAHPPAWFTGFSPHQADGYVLRNYRLNPYVGRLPLVGIVPFDRETITIFYSPAGAARTAVRALATSAGASIKCNEW